MANVTTLKKGGTDVYAGSEPVVIKYKLNVATAVAAGLTTTGLVNILSVPANTHVKVLSVNTTTAVAGTTVDVELGDAGDDDRFVATKDGTTGLHTITSSGSAGYTYTSAATISAKITSDALATGVVEYVFEITNAKYLAPATCPTL
jgi:hypothetical protein